MTNTNTEVKFDLVAIGTLAKTLQAANLPESLIQSNIKAMFKGFNVAKISDAIAAYDAKVDREDKLAKLAKLSYTDKMALAQSDPDYVALLARATAELATFRNTRAALFAYAKEKFALDLKWQTEEEFPTASRVQRAEGSNANGGAEKGGITYPNGVYTGVVDDRTYYMIVDHTQPEDSTYSCVRLLDGDVLFGVPSPRVASDYLNNLHSDSAGQLSAKEFWQRADDATSSLIANDDRKLQPLPQRYLSWAKADTRRVVATHVWKYSIK